MTVKRYSNCIKNTFIQFVLLVVLILAMGCSNEKAFAGSGVSLDAISFLHHNLIEPEQVKRVRAAGNLAGQSRESSPSVQGWFEYEFDISQAGWYVVVVESDTERFSQTRYGFHQDYIIDSEIFFDARGYPGWKQEGSFTLGNVWITKGKHTLRIQNYAWQGMHPIRQIHIQPALNQLEQRVRVTVQNDNFFSASFIRLGESLELDVVADGHQQDSLFVEVEDRNTKLVVHRSDPLAIPVVSPPKSVAYSLSGLKAGSYTIRFRTENRKLPQRYVRHINFEVIDVRPVSIINSDKRGRRELARIDCVKNKPDYSAGSADNTRIGKVAIGEQYRESGIQGYRQHRKAGEFSWFAYRLSKVQSQKPYLVEVDYPDDAFRTFVISIRDGNPLYYTLSSGVDSGGEFSLSGKIQTHSMLYWPRSDVIPRVALLNAQDGGRAACSEIRLYALQDPVVRRTENVPSYGRHYGHWFEEPDRFAAVFGSERRGNWPTLTGYRQSAERWIQTLAAIGGDTLVVTAVGYGWSLYPSRNYNKDIASAYTTDIVKLILLLAEKYGMRVILDVNPRANDLVWFHRNAGTEYESLLYNNQGKTRFTVTTGHGQGARTQQPFFNPLLPANRDWYAGMLSELATRYSGFPAFQGITIRVSEFENRSLNNFFSLRWGYGDFMMREFRNDTGIDLIRLDSMQRYRKLTAKSLRKSWVNWRSTRLTSVYQQLSNYIQKSDSRLKLYANVLGGRFFPDSLEEAGLDSEKINAVPGIKLVNARYHYGRQSRQSSPWQAKVEDRKIREQLIDPGKLAALSQDVQGAYLFPARYLELNAASLMPDSIGFDKKSRASYTSAHVVPAGRNNLERFALALAENDADFLLNGGNAYFIDQPVMGEFLKEYRSLPARPFVRRKDASDPVALWERRQLDGLYFYTVNRLPYTVQVQIGLSRATIAHRLVNEVALGPESHRINIELNGFQLLAGRLPPGVHIKSVQVTAPREQLAALQKEIEGLFKLVANARSSMPKQAHSDLTSLIEMAAEQLAQGRIWRTGSLLQDHRLIIARAQFSVVKSED